MNRVLLGFLCAAATSHQTLGPASSGPHLDRFGVQKLFPTKTGAREWCAKWDNNHARTVASGERDPDDAEFITRGNGQIAIDGHGVAKALGAGQDMNPRLYVYDAGKAKKWQNVEITFYARRVSDAFPLSYQGWTSGARSEHQDADDKHRCSGRTYYGRMLYDGRINFQKEVIHHGAYSNNLPSEESKAPWKTSNGTMPFDIWVGYKFVVRNCDRNTHVRLTLYRDMANGDRGGKWEKMIEITDKGEWSQTNSGLDIQKECGCPANQIMLAPGTSVFIRNDGVVEADYQKFSIREVAPDV